MLKGSILGKIYIYWQYSFIYSILADVAHCLDNAWHHSLIRRMLVHESRIQSLYEEGFISCAIDGIINFILKIISAICEFFKPAFFNSLAYSLGNGSVFLKFDFMLGAFICLMFMVPHKKWSNAIVLLAALGFACLLMLLAAINKRKLVYPKELGVPFLLFVAATFISPIYSHVPSDSIRVMLFFVSAFLLMWVVASNIDSTEKLKTIMGWIYISVIFVSAYAVGQRATGMQADPTFIDSVVNPNIPARVYSTLDNPNNLAEFIVLLAPLSCVYAMNEKDIQKRCVLCGLMVLPAAAILMTYSRAGWLSIALAVLVFVYFTNRRIIPWMFAAALVCVPFLPASILTRLGNMFNTADSSANFRLQLWGSCLRLLSMENRWLTGIGLGPITFNHNMILVTTPIIANGMPHTQMLYIELVSEWGLLGFISYMWFIVARLRDACVEIYRAANEYTKGALIASVSAFVGIAILCIFEYIWFYPRILFAYFILLGILIASVKLSRGERNGKN